MSRPGSRRVALTFAVGALCATAHHVHGQPAGPLIRRTGPEGPHAIEEWQAPAEHRMRFNPLGAAPDVLKKGRALYVQNCVLCHGEKGLGDGPLSRMHAQRTGIAPRDLSSTHVQAEMTDGEIFWKVTNGRRRQGRIIMPAFGEDRSETDLWSLVIYVRSLSRQQAAK